MLRVGENSSTFPEIANVGRDAEARPADLFGVTYGHDNVRKTQKHGSVVFKGLKV